MLDRQKFVFVFLRVLQVAGNIQKVLVKAGDTVVLNCTCTTQTNGLWNGPNKSDSSMKDIDEEQLIPYSQGVLLNPKLDLLKYYIVGSYKDRTCNLMIKQFASNDEGKYRCQYVENDTTISRFYRVSIHTPFDVSIRTTHLENTTYLECNATGGSGPYTFKDWEHKSVSGKHIRYIEYTKDGTLVLKKDNYQNNGIYICRVNDEFIEMYIDHYEQQKQVLVQYEGPPVFVSNNSKTWLSQYHGEVIVTLKVFTSSHITSIPILKLNEQSDERQSSEVIGLLMNWTCTDHLVFYNVNVKVPCVEVTFNVKTIKDESRHYSSKVCNIFGCSFFDLTVMTTDGNTTCLLDGNTTSFLNDGFKSTFLHDYCWITIGSIVGGILIICVWSHIYCYLKREKTCRSNIIQITPGDNYDEVEHLNYNNVIFDYVPNDANINNMNNDNLSSIIENNDIISRADVNSSDDSSSIKLSGDGYENPYQTINSCDIEMHHYSSIVSCNYQNTIIFPPTLTADTLDNSNTAADNLKNPWLVIYMRKQ